MTNLVILLITLNSVVLTVVAYNAHKLNEVCKFLKWWNRNFVEDQ